MSPSKVLVIIPTYNELNNIARVLEKVFSLDPRFSVLVVDDSSPDGTAKLVRAMQKEQARLFFA